MKILLIGFDQDSFRKIKETLSGVEIQGVYTLEEAESIITVSPDAKEVKIIVINSTMFLPAEKLIPVGQFIERIKPIYQEVIVVVTNSFDTHWKILSKLGATHRAHDFTVQMLLQNILKDKNQPQEVKCT